MRKLVFFYNKRFFITLLSFTYLIIFLSYCYSAEHRKPQNNIVYGTQTANCGPIVLHHIFKAYDEKISVEKLIKECHVTTLGFCSLSDLKRVVEINGFYALPIKTDYNSLLKLKSKGYEVICHFSKNKHFVRLLDIDSNSVKFFDPNWKVNKKNIHSLPRNRFSKEWPGYALLISDKPIN